MKEKLVEVKVTKEHIKAGIPFGIAHCPIALALKDTIPGIAWMHVRLGNISFHKSEMHIHDEFKIYTLKPCEEANYFMSRFDRKLEVKPQTFVMELTNV